LKLFIVSSIATAIATEATTADIQTVVKPKLAEDFPWRSAGESMKETANIATGRVVSGWVKPEAVAGAQTIASVSTKAAKASVPKVNVKAKTAGAVQAETAKPLKSKRGKQVTSNAFATKAVQAISNMRSKPSVRVGVKNGHVDGYLEISNCFNNSAVNEVVRWTAPLGLCTPNDQYFGLSDSPFAKFEFHPEDENTWVGSVTGFKDRGCETKGRVEHYKIRRGCNDGLEVRVVPTKSPHRMGLNTRNHIAGDCNGAHTDIWYADGICVPDMATNTSWVVSCERQNMITFSDPHCTYTNSWIYLGDMGFGECNIEQTNNARGTNPGYLATEQVCGGVVPTCNPAPKFERSQMVVGWQANTVFSTLSGVSIMTPYYYYPQCQSYSVQLPNRWTIAETSSYEALWMANSYSWSTPALVFSDGSAWSTANMYNSYPTRVMFAQTEGDGYDNLLQNEWGYYVRYCDAQIMITTQACPGWDNFLLWGQ